MATSATRRVLRLLFGEEGTVATESGMQVVMVGMALAVTGIFAMSPILSSLTGPLAVSDAEVGAVITAYTAPSILLVPVMGFLADRVGRRPLFVGGFVCFGVGGVAVALTTDFTVVLGLRALQGVGYAALNPLGVTIIGDLFTGSREATAQGLRVAGIQSASLVVPPVAGLLVVGAWQYPFLIYALALPVAVWAWVALPEADIDPGGDTVRDYVRDLAALLRQPALAGIQLSFVVRFALSFGYYAYISVLLARTLGASAVTTGLVVSGGGLTALVASTQVGRVAAERDSELVLVGGLLAVGGGIALIGAYPSYLTVALGALLLGVGLGTSGPIQKSLVTASSPAELRAGAVSTALLAQSIGMTGGPLVLGLLLVRTGAPAAFVLWGLLGGAVAVGLVLVAYRSGPDTA